MSWLLYRILALFWMAVVPAGIARAQASGAEDAAQQQFGNMASFFLKVVQGPISKILALMFLVVGIWKLVSKDYGAAAGCVIALLALVFLPQLISIFPS
ncbi:MAG: hypothetical protein HQL19_07215 [Candidatus Omnitrophica bacterium]|nr:hypothetical protein [Candidatus Omnitrophota bacterium]